jgi:hypothetical protein
LGADNYDFPSGYEAVNVDQAKTLICIQKHDSTYGQYTNTSCANSDITVYQVLLDVRLVGLDGKVLNQKSFTGPTPPYGLPGSASECFGEEEYGKDTILQVYQGWLGQVLT